MFQFSHGVRNCIFRLLIYRNISSSEISKSHWDCSWPCSCLTEQRGLQVNKNPKSSAVPLSCTHKHELMSFTFLNVVAGSTEGLCSFRQRVNVGLPLCILCLIPIFPRGFPTPSSFSLTTSAWDLFAQTLSGPISPYLEGSYTTYNATLCHTCIWLPISPQKPATSSLGGIWYPLTQMICSPSCSLPILVFHIPYNRDLCQANVYWD